MRPYLTLLVLLSVQLLFFTCETKESVLKILEEKLRSHFDSELLLPQQFPTLKSMGITTNDLREGILYKGDSTQRKINQIRTKILQGKTVYMVLVGTGNAAGGDLGPNSEEKTFQYAFQAWWKHSIESLTGSKLEFSTIAIGSTDIGYLSFCWKEYLPRNTCWNDIDFVLLELITRSPSSWENTVDLDRFIESVRSVIGQPGLLLLTFFRLWLFEKESGYNQTYLDPESKSQKQHLINAARRHEITLLELENMMTNAWIQKSSNLTFEDYISEGHPSLVAHTQLAYILVIYFRSALYTSFSLEHLNIWERSFNSNPVVNATSVTYNDPLYSNNETVCWTAVSEDIRRKLRHPLFDLPLLVSQGFFQYFQVKSLTETRYDSLGGYFTYTKQSTLMLKLDTREMIQEGDRNLYIVVRQKEYGGQVIVTVYSYVTTAVLCRVVVDASDKVYLALYVHFVCKVHQGQYILSLQTLDKGIFLNSVILSRT